jgi:hypothetical protein
LNMHASAFPVACYGVSEQFNKNALFPYMWKIPRSLLRGVSITDVRHSDIRRGGPAYETIVRDIAGHSTFSIRRGL